MAHRSHALSVPVMPGSASADPSSEVIDTRALTKRYGSTIALDGLDLTVRAGEVYGFLGPNGAGKTTTIRLLLGLHRPTGGSASVFGLDAWSAPVEIHRRLGHVSSSPALWPQMNAAEIFELVSALRGGVDRRYRDELVDRLELDVSKRVRALSTGNRQKVALIAALCARPQLLLLDEPTTGLDPLMQAVFRAAVQEARERGQTVLLSSHLLGEVEQLCDRVGILREGRLVDQGTLHELRQLASQAVEVSFSADVEPVPALDGVAVVDVEPRRWRLQVSGPIAPLVDALAGLPVLELSSREPSLEEIFLHHYRRGDRELA